MVHGACVFSIQSFRELLAEFEPGFASREAPDTRELAASLLAVCKLLIRRSCVTPCPHVS